MITYSDAFKKGYRAGQDDQIESRTSYRRCPNPYFSGQPYRDWAQGYEAGWNDRVEGRNALEAA